MKKLICFVILAIFLFGCENSIVPPLTPNGTVLLKMDGLVDSLYNKTGNEKSSEKVVGYVPFSSAEHVQITATLNGKHSITYLELTYFLMVVDTSLIFHYTQRLNGIVYIDATVHSPDRNSNVLTGIYAYHRDDWISIRDLKIIKVD